MDTIQSLKPTIIPRAEHTISRANISPNALKVLYRLRDTGHQACLVGGSVRDLLLGREPKDFDVCTDAHPEVVHKLFRNCRLIGRRFRLAHIQFGREIIEVATFRAQQNNDDSDSAVRLDNGRIISDNVYGTIDEDAARRDFTINALYYSIDDFSLLEYANGLADLKAGIIRLIGDPEQRYREDPVRMLRAVRFAAKLGFRLDPATEAPIYNCRHMLREVPAARLFDEVLKLFLSGYAVQIFELLRLYGLFSELFPMTDRCLRTQKNGFPRSLLVRALTNTDTRIMEEKPVTPAFLYAALLWEPLREHVEHLQATGMDQYVAITTAADKIILNQVRHTALPRRFSLPMREIWELQPRFINRAGNRPLRLLNHPRFRAAYDFLLLRAEAGEDVADLATWWTEFLAANQDQENATPRTTKANEQQRPRRRRAAGGRR